MADAARVRLNGAAATVDDLRHLVATNYGHFSAMRCERGGVRGLDLHAQRIVAATRELFDAAIDAGRVRACLRDAIDGATQPLSLRLNVFSRALDRDRPGVGAEPDILVVAAPAKPGAATPLTVKSFRFTRTLAHVKHVGTFPLFHYRRLAQRAGFDDALFVDENGAIEEGSIWNVGFCDGESVVWPDAPRLTGVSMQLLQAGLERAGLRSEMRAVPLADIGRFRCAFFTHSSTPVRPIARIDDVTFEVDADLCQRLVACHDGNPLQMP